jgi:hypothetical protein
VRSRKAFGASAKLKTGKLPADSWRHQSLARRCVRDMRTPRIPCCLQELLSTDTQNLLLHTHLISAVLLLTCTSHGKSIMRRRMSCLFLEIWRYGENVKILALPTVVQPLHYLHSANSIVHIYCALAMNPQNAS